MVRRRRAPHAAAPHAAAPHRLALTAAALGAALALGPPGAKAAAQTAPRSAGPAAVTGLVRDSLGSPGGAAFAGAAVHLVPAGTPGAPGQVAVTDSAGRFRLDSVAPGRYLAGFLHPRLDSLGLEAPTRVVEVGPGAAEVRADLALPGAPALAAAVCGARGGATGVLLGRVLDAERGEPVSGGAVVVRWGEVVLNRRGVRRAVEERRGTVGPGGRYAVCGVPAGDDVTVQAVATLATRATGTTAGPAPGDSAVSGVVDVRLPPEAPWLYRELLVDLRVAAWPPTTTAASTVVPPPADPAPLPVPPGTPAGGAPAARGTAALAGRVRDRDGRPLAGARVVVRTRTAWGDPVSPGGVEAASDALAVTGADGAYRLAGLPAGTRAVAVFALGHTPARAAADLRPGRVTAADFTAGPRVVTLDAVRVSASRVNPASEFARHRRRGFGYFSDPDAIARRRPNSVADVLVGAPGLHVAGTARGRPIMRGRLGCAPTLFVDGARVADGDSSDLDSHVPLRYVGAVEVYPSAFDAPAQYGGWSSCAVVLLWTKRALR
jgi:hypothetical protein